MSNTAGFCIARARKAAGLTLRAVGDHLGVSVPYLHDVEHDRRALVVARWAALVEVLPTLSIRTLAEATLAAGPVEIDARLLTPRQRAQLVEALEEQAGAAA